MNEVPPEVGAEAKQRPIQEMNVVSHVEGAPMLQTFKKSKKLVCGPSTQQSVREKSRCHDCETRKMTRTRRPATTPRSNTSNTVVGVDTEKMPSLSHQERHCWLSMICWCVKPAVAVRTSTNMNPAAGTALETCFEQKVESLDIFHQVPQLRSPLETGKTTSPSRSITSWHEKASSRKRRLRTMS